MKRPYRLFDGLGIEIEFMVVDRATLDVRPWVDRVMSAECGEPVSELARGEMSWCNELAAHVVEIKTTDPVPGPDAVMEGFRRELHCIRGHLAGWDAAILPGPAHPWMDPRRETVLWPHEHHEWYRMFDRLFDCRRHGWANLQSMHLNLPFHGDEEFARLHAAIRILLPLIPALAAGSPYLDGAYAGRLDPRMEVYRTNSELIPSIAGRVIPEPVFSEAEYQERILLPMYADIAPLDPDGVLREPWLNARGAIARFDRGSIEIRVIDSQECAQADLAVAWAIWHVLRALVDERWTPVRFQQQWEIDPLHGVLLDTIRDAEAALIDNPEYLRVFGAGPDPMTAGALWGRLRKACIPHHAAFDDWFDLYARQGTLSRRLLQRAGERPDRPKLQDLFRDLQRHHESERLFEA